MDEAQALADTVVVIAAGRVVASGSPDTLGGRDQGETTVRFVLPPGCGVGDVPLPDGLVPEVRGEFVEFRIAEPTEVIHTLTGWALGRGQLLDGLAVIRPSLEDVYLSLTGGADGGADGGGGVVGTGQSGSGAKPKPSPGPVRGADQ
jgi:ABC-2 type transport system ATP-binding protein